MRRFEALRPYRAGLRAILRDSVGNPALLGMLPGLLRSMGWTLTAAGLPASGCRGRIARRVVGAIYVSLLPAFFRDESRDLGTTMATLDKRLRQVEQIFSTLGPVVSAGLGSPPRPSLSFVRRKIYGRSPLTKSVTAAILGIVQCSINRNCSP